MKSLFFFLLSLSFIENGVGQTRDLHIVASSGATYQANVLQLDWTLGEVIIQTLEKPLVILSQGFHQPDYDPGPVPPIPDSSGTFQIGPNPFDDEFTIKLTLNAFQKGVFSLFDMAGKLLWTKPFEGSSWSETFAATSLPAGQYIFTVILSDDSILYAYPLTKIQ